MHDSDSERFEKFSEKVAEIDKHNEEFEKGKSLYARDVNQFTDMVWTKKNINPLLPFKIRKRIKETKTGTDKKM